MTLCSLRNDFCNRLSRMFLAASGLISDGSELLLATPWRGLVGTVVLPILGAVPDGAIVIFSGLGADAQQQMNVGVGALAGSTVMLLTLPWSLAVFAGRVNLLDGKPMYQQPYAQRLTPPGNLGLCSTGVACGEASSKNCLNRSPNHNHNRRTSPGMVG